MASLNGQVAIITGASSGIGKAVAKDLDEAGVKLVLTARREDRLRELAKSCKSAAIVAGDMTEPLLPKKLLDTALERFGKCDIVFNGAGVMDAGTIEETDIERLCHMVRINVEAAFRMAYVVLKHFRTVNSGHLINVSSILGTKVRPGAGAYAGTKYAMEALSEALRMELGGSNIKVSCLAPGLVLTELHDHWPVHPAKRLNIAKPVMPEDVARCVRFLLEQPEHVRIARLMIMPGEQQL